MSDLGDKRIQAAFEAGVILKGVGALVECVAGLSLYLVNVDWLTSLAARVAEHELIGHPRDRIANALMHWAENYSGGGKTFAGLYLLSHGVVKLFLVVELLRNRMWAYPASIAVIGMFIAYQLYRMTFAFSIGLVLLTFFDVVVVVLIAREYRMIRERQASAT